MWRACPPTSYQWYFEGVPIAGADQRVYNIVDATVEDAGVYRLDAFDGEGNMLLSMDNRRPRHRRYRAQVRR